MACMNTVAMALALLAPVSCAAVLPAPHASSVTVAGSGKSPSAWLGSGKDARDRLLKRASECAGDIVSYLEKSNAHREIAAALSLKGEGRDGESVLARRATAVAEARAEEFGHVMEVARALYYNRGPRAVEEACARLDMAAARSRAALEDYSEACRDASK